MRGRVPLVPNGNHIYSTVFSGTLAMLVAVFTCPQRHQYGGVQPHITQNAARRARLPRIQAYTGRSLESWRTLSAATSNISRRFFSATCLKAALYRPKSQVLKNSLPARSPD